MRALTRPTSPRRAFARGLLALACLALVTALATTPTPATAQDAPTAKAPAWTKITQDQGVTVWEREVPGQDLPAFRGVITVPARLVDVLAVLADADNVSTWSHKCGESRLLANSTSNLNRAMYIRTDSPWPVDDRDVIVEHRVTLRPKQREVFIKFKAVNGARYGIKPVDGVVRMPTLTGHYKLRILDAKRTRIEYQVNADPGGSLPAWLIASASRDLPVLTLVGLSKRVQKTLGTHTAFLNLWDPSRTGGKLPEAFKQ